MHADTTPLFRKLLPQAWCGPDVRPLRTGFDIVQISRISASVARFGQAFTHRLYTLRELAQVSHGDALNHDSLAARFAAKEAVIKALALSEAGVCWRDIEVLKQAAGHCELQLHGCVAAQADQAGCKHWQLSLSHEGDYAGAVVMALSQAATRPFQDTPYKANPRTSMPQDKLTIRSVLRDHGRLNQDINLITDDADLYKSGMTSHASVNVMLALEGQFDIEFPDHFLKRSVFSSIDSIHRAVSELHANP
jgi:phosphopantetheine--protein transferase-like protein